MLCFHGSGSEAILQISQVDPLTIHAGAGALWATEARIMTQGENRVKRGARENYIYPTSHLALCHDTRPCGCWQQLLPNMYGSLIRDHLIAYKVKILKRIHHLFQYTSFMKFFVCIVIWFTYMLLLTLFVCTFSI